jgi:hypothetical protein
MTTVNCLQAFNKKIIKETNISNQHKLIKVLIVTSEWSCMTGSENCSSPYSAIMTSGLHMDSNEVMSEFESCSTLLAFILTCKIRNQ